MDKEITKEEVFELTTDMIESIKEGLKDIEEGNLIPHDEVMKRDKDWLNSK